MIQEIGIHRVRHGDVNRLPGIQELMAGEKADLMYSDPPWGQGHIKYWSTMNRKMNNQFVVPASLDVFLSSIFTIAEKHVSRFLLIEYGIRWREMIQERGIGAGFVSHGIIPLKYQAGKSGLLPLDLHMFARYGESIPVECKEAEGTHGYKTNRLAIGPLAKKIKQSNADAIVLDPCCGMGYTAQAAMDFGMAFRGNEMNRKRLDKTITRLSKVRSRK